MMKTSPSGQVRKKAIVTGGAVRLGRAIAVGLAKNGYDIQLHYKSSADAALSLQEELKNLGAHCSIHRADLTDPERADNFIEAIGGSDEDLLVNNASIYGSDDLRAMTHEDLVRHLTLNAYAPLALSRAFAKDKQSGCIVNILDSRIGEYDAKHVSYHLSKRLLYDVTRMAALEFAPRVRVNAVAPGIVLPPPGLGRDYVDSIATRYPLGRSAAPEDIAEAVIFLAKMESMTGQVIFMDGGNHLQGSVY